MENIAEDSSVFVENSWSITDWKSCIFFWEHVYVYEEFLYNVGRAGVPDDDALLEFTKKLLKNGILKVVTTDGYNLKAGLYDKVYAGVDDELYDILCKKVNDIAVDVTLPDDYKDIIIHNAESDYQDSKLCESMDSIRYNNIKESVLEGARQSKYGGFAKTYMPEIYDQSTNDIINLMESHYQNLHPDSKYHFEHRNKSLLVKNSVSSSILTSENEIRYYNHKMASFKDTNATKYIESVNSSMPFINKESIDDLTYDELLRIRKKSSWKKAMHQLGDICRNIKYTENIDEYKKQIDKELIAAYNDSVSKLQGSYIDLAKDISKNAVLVGMSFIPTVGTPASIACTGFDCVKSYLNTKNNQKNLIFFLSDLSKNKY